VEGGLDLRHLRDGVGIHYSKVAILSEASEIGAGTSSSDHMVIIPAPTARACSQTKPAAATTFLHCHNPSQ
jgi:hypothetical protein